MKKIFIYSLIVTFVVSFASCKKDETKIFLTDTPVAPTLSAPANNLTIVLNPADSLGLFTPISWSAADYGYKASIQYNVLFSKSQDMSKAKSLMSVNNATNINSLTNLAFDQFLLSNLFLTPKVATTVYYRVIAMVTGLPSATYPLGGVTSGIQSMTVTPFYTPVSIHTWGIVGSATPNGWGGPDYVMDDGDATGTYTATVKLVVGEIKFRFDNNWNNNLGGSNGTLTQGGANIAIAAAGTYTITLNTNNNTYTITLVNS